MQEASPTARVGFIRTRRFRHAGRTTSEGDLGSTAAALSESQESRRGDGLISELRRNTRATCAKVANSSTSTRHIIHHEVNNSMLRWNGLSRPVYAWTGRFSLPLQRRHVSTDLTNKQQHRLNKLRTALEK